MPSQPDFHLLRVYRTVVECGSFRAAQSKLGCRAPAISMNIKKLEQKLGFALCLRGRSGVRLTPGGKIIYEAACRLFLATGDFDGEVQRAKDQPFNKIRICLCDAIHADDSFSVSSVFAQFMTRRGGLTLAVDTLPPPDIEQQVVDEIRYDLGITPSFQNLDGLIYEPLMEETQVLMCARGHPLFDDSPDGVDLSALERFPRFGRSYMTAPGLRSIPGSGVPESSVSFHRSGDAAGAYRPLHRLSAGARRTRAFHGRKHAGNSSGAHPLHLQNLCDLQKKSPVRGCALATHRTVETSTDQAPPN